VVKFAQWALNQTATGWLNTACLLDALMALHDATAGDCRTSEICDADGDEEVTAIDALLLLRYAVSPPVELVCGCTYLDQ